MPRLCEDGGNVEFMALMEDAKLPKCVMPRRQEMEWMGCLLDDLRAFGFMTGEWAIAAQVANELHKAVK